MHFNAGAFDLFIRLCVFDKLTKCFEIYCIYVIIKLKIHIFPLDKLKLPALPLVILKTYLAHQVYLAS